MHHLQNDQNARIDRRLRVAVEDVNDNAPLLQPFDGAVLENSPPTLITTISAVDKDVSPQFRQVMKTICLEKKCYLNFIV